MNLNTNAITNLGRARIPAEVTGTRDAREPPAGVGALKGCGYPSIKRPLVWKEERTGHYLVPRFLAHLLDS